MYEPSEDIVQIYSLNFNGGVYKNNSISYAKDNIFYTSSHPLNRFFAAVSPDQNQIFRHIGNNYK